MLFPDWLIFISNLLINTCDHEQSAAHKFHSFILQSQFHAAADAS